MAAVICRGTSGRSNETAPALGGGVPSPLAQHRRVARRATGGMLGRDAGSNPGAVIITVASALGGSADIGRARCPGQLMTQSGRCKLTGGGHERLGSHAPHLSPAARGPSAKVDVSPAHEVLADAWRICAARLRKICGSQSRSMLNRGIECATGARTTH